MALSLSPEKQEEVFVFMKKAFSDFPYFDSLIAQPIRKLIQDANSIEIDRNFVKVIAERYLDVNAFLAKDQKQLLDSLKIILTATAIHLYSFSEASREVPLFTTFEELSSAYPDLMEDVDPDVDEQEVKYLLLYRNYMMLALRLVPAKGNKLFLLRIMERLEGSNEQYITGTGQKRTVTRRVSIYQREGDVIAIKKNAKRAREIVEAEKAQKEQERQMKIMEGKFRGKKVKQMTKEEQLEFAEKIQSAKSTSSPASSVVSSAPENSPPLGLTILAETATVPQLALPPSVSYTPAVNPVVQSVAPAPKVSHTAYPSRGLSTEERIDALNQVLLNEQYVGSFTEEIMTHILHNTNEAK